MSSIQFDSAASLFYVPLPGALSHIWLTHTREGDEEALIALNNVPDIGPRSFFTAYPFTEEHAKESIAKGLAVSTPLITDQVKQEGKLAQTDLPLFLLHVIRDSRTMQVVCRVLILPRLSAQV